METKRDMQPRPALLIAGRASGQGKTSVTAALARHHARAGRLARMFVEILRP
jgi:cobyrinic acid a,c-diamide synthase